jgi:hypothetical protein
MLTVGEFAPVGSVGAKYIGIEPLAIGKVFVFADVSQTLCPLVSVKVVVTFPFVIVNTGGVAHDVVTPEVALTRVIY